MVHDTSADTGDKSRVVGKEVYSRVTIQLSVTRTKYLR